MKVRSGFVFLFFLLQVALASANWTRIIGDIEGIPKRWKQLQAEGVISISAAGEVSLNDGHSLTFEGDLMKRGPYGKFTVDTVVSLMNRYNTDPASPRIRVVLGNHDLNSFSLLQSQALMELGEASDFNKWLEKNGRQNDFNSRLDYWMSYNGVTDKVHWFWLELAAEKLGRDALELKAEFYPEGKPLVAELAKVISQNEVYQRFYDYIKPGGKLFELYAKAEVIDVYQTKENVRYMSFHSGILTTGNFGVVPGESMGLFERAVRHFFEADAERILNQYDFNKIEDVERFERRYPGTAWKAIVLWAERYNQFIKNEMSEISKTTAKLKGESGLSAISNKSPATMSMANQLYVSRLAALGDAGWDPVTGKLQVEANSLVYPDSRVAKGSSIPGLPEDFIIKVLGLAKVDFVTGGHQPVGDGMIHRSAHPYNRVIQFLLTDTSFSPVEQQDFVRVHDNGRLQFRTTNRDGVTMLIDRPGQAELDRMQSLIQRWNALPKENRARATAATRTIYENLIKKDEGLKKLGLLANGWLIVGFAEKDLGNGRTGPDYENFILFQKQGRNMVYKTVDIWGLTSPDVKLEFAKTDLSEMVKSAREEKIEDLKKHGKEVLSLLGFERLVRGKNVMVISGPALNSLNKALKNPGAQQALDQFVAEFKAHLQRIPPQESWVFIGGGTQGFEEILNRVILEVSQNRPVPFEMVGVVAGVTGGAELDRSVKKYLPLHQAFYWDDYFTELLPLLTKTKLARPAQLQFLFGGGGAIVTKQIRETIAVQDAGAKIELIMMPGLSIGFENPKDISATDQFLLSDFGKSRMSTSLTDNRVRFWDSIPRLVRSCSRAHVLF